MVREYFNRPQDTAAAFVDGWLRTGDIARMAPDGHMYFVDRARDMIVSGGLNIYSAEVEGEMARHDGETGGNTDGQDQPAQTFDR